MKPDPLPDRVFFYPNGRYNQFDGNYALSFDFFEKSAKKRMNQTRIRIAAKQTEKILFASFHIKMYEAGHSTAEAGIKALNISHIRYPGGNFLSGYRWEDGVGNRESRPIRRDLAWFAINEFVSYCRRNGIEPMIDVNPGTRFPQDAANPLEYCNVDSGTYYSDLRRSHGYENPHNIKLWCLGNEMDGPWQICSKTAEEYGRIACETAKMMKWVDPSIELVACGGSFRDMLTFGTRECTIVSHCREYVDYLSLHQYCNNDNGDMPTFLARSAEMDSFIKEVATICADEKSETGFGSRHQAFF